MLRRIALQQTAFREGGSLDGDEDGEGEYGLLEDLARAGLLAPGMELEADGALRFGGYVYRLYLPDRGGAGVDDRRIVDPELAERFWVLYAWPEERTDETRTTFCITASGTVTRSIGNRYSLELPPQPDAGLLARAKKAGVVTNWAAVGIEGNDGHMWFQCNDGGEPLPFAEDD